jgi:LuxR family quorum sensing-dependent transcriptional regulator
VRRAFSCFRTMATSETLLQRTFDTVDALAVLDRPDEILAVASEQFRDFGYSAFVLSRLPRTTSNIEPFILLNGWPDGWTERYVEADHYERDPLRRYCMSTERVFSWNDIPNDLIEDKRAAAVIHEAGAFGFSQGLCVPLHTQFGAGGLSLAGADVDEAPGMRAMIRLLAFYLCSAVERTTADTKTLPKLTPRERDILTWVALGKTAPEIAAALGISDYTVTHHLQNVRIKLGTRNNAHSVAIALRAGQIAI